MSEQNPAPSESTNDDQPTAGASAAKPASKRSAGPVETLDRPALLRRYRTLRNLVALLVVLVVVLGGVAATQYVQLRDASQPNIAAGSGESGATDAQTAAKECPAPVRRDSADPMAMGSVDAPVVLAEWTDFRCPYCGVFSRDTLPILKEEYIDTGKVRLEVHDVDFIEGDVSAQVAVAARAAGQQDRYFEYLFAVYDDMRDDRHEITEERLLAYAKQAEVPDLAAFTRDLGSEELRNAVRASAEEAKSLGISSVPFFVNTDNCQALSGAQPAAEFRRFLDAAVAEASSEK